MLISKHLHQPEQTVLWCPPLSKGKRALTSLWRIASSDLLAENREQFVNQISRTLADSEYWRANNLIEAWVTSSVSKFNHYRPAKVLPKSFVLVLISKQDISVVSQMVEHAARYCLAHNLSTVMLASDQDGASIDKTLLTTDFNLPSGVLLHTQAEPCHHSSLLAEASAIVVFDSWLGFEALLRQKPVIVWGAPFYAGLGLTIDLQTYTTRYNISLQQLVYYVLLEQAVSICPETNKEITTEQALLWLHMQNQQRWRFNDNIYAVGFSRFWKSEVQAFFQGSEIHFVKRAAQVPAGATAVAWGRKNLSLASDVKLYRLEDGFLRSVGLGALFTKPLSWVADSQGLYFDATAPSDLELLLSQQRFSQNQLEMAQQLRLRICANCISKYNTGTNLWQRPSTFRKVILVPGQVESDASIAFGAPGIKKNIDLVKSVRSANPDAYIVYKPHPDVLAGARALGVNEQSVNEFCDEIAENVDISTILEQVDEVHVLTSLTGFEALLREKHVTCYGLPFYAGWGLTKDFEKCTRRKRNLTIDELVAGALVCYPLYISKQSGYYSNAINTVEELANWREGNKRTHTLWHWAVRKCLNLLRGKK